MPTRVTLVSDTHVPKRAKQLPETVWRAVESADVVIHAGDWVELSMLDDFERRSRRLLAVRGNNDGPEFEPRLPLVATADIEGARIVVVHETGPALRREERADAEYPEADVIVFGHSHIPWDSVTAAGTRMLNPGSPTDRRRQPACTFMTLVLDDGRVRDVEVVRLPLRSSPR
ncbi:hypothetical protein EDF46_0493 [Frondihabitans sp. PhB188]|uniref:metallophosphoesterase family protein n=1 Tax=Frondihabitans sp. PhB188 TaxID=2485200 RepID=UPI000F475305|nr:metallophosphoesterase [Frondihabitans sp. PhB188]ROQ41122.1 hypothetical protein EDF46_0493 [Frondihabitans sp. PhB188]